MDYLQIGLILVAPLPIIVIAANLVKTEARRIQKMRERAERKRRRRPWSEISLATPPPSRYSWHCHCC